LRPPNRQKRRLEFTPGVVGALPEFTSSPSLLAEFTLNAADAPPGPRMARSGGRTAAWLYLSYHPCGRRDQDGLVLGDLNDLMDEMFDSKQGVLGTSHFLGHGSGDRAGARTWLRSLRSGEQLGNLNTQRCGQNG